MEDDFNRPEENSQSYQSQEETYRPEPEPKVEEPMPVESDSIIESNLSKSDLDAELEDFLSKQKAKIKVIGCGGGGNNTIDRITEVGVAGAETIAINTDAQDLLYTTADKKMLIGKDVTHGMGAGSNPKLGEEAAKENETDIKKVIAGADLVFEIPCLP